MAAIYLDHASTTPVLPAVLEAIYAAFAEAGMAMGFQHVESAPLVRSSYHAREQAECE